jgi:hypothetical protein
MTIVHYAPTTTLREARALYFAANGFGPNGGYDDAWVDFKLGPVPLPFPNTRARVRAVGFHDLHHVLTGYDTDTIGEFEISAWEIAAGCKGFVAAWQLNLGGMFAGLLVAPRRTFRAFLRGRHSRSLYGGELEALLDCSVAQLRDRTGVDQPTAALRAADAALFGLAQLAGLPMALLGLAFALLFLPWGLATLAWRRAKAATKAPHPS